MGKWAEKRKKNTIKNEIYHRLSTMFAEGKGRSRYEDKKEGIDRKYIYTEKTYTDYKYIGKKYLEWIREKHPECKHLRECKKYVNDYLQDLIDAEKSAFTCSTYKAALAKIFKTDYSQFISTPPRERQNVRRSRYSVPFDAHISKEKEEYYGKITGCTGLRLKELVRVRGCDLGFDLETQKYYIHVCRGTKGGKERNVEIIGSQEDIDFIVDLFRDKGDRPVFGYPPKAFDNHHYRAVYAQNYYNMIARPMDEIPKEDRYYMKKERKGTILDRKAMKIVSESMGHERIDVISKSYLY